MELSGKFKKAFEEIQTMTDEELEKKFNCDISKICKGNYIARFTNDLVCPYKVILGQATFNRSICESLGELTFVGAEKLQGSETYHGLDIRDSKIKDFGKVHTVLGSVDFNSEDIVDMGNIKHIGASLYLNHSNVESLGNLEEVGGVLSLDYSKLTSLGNLKYAKYIICRKSVLNDIGKLKEFYKIDMLDPKLQEPLERLKYKKIALSNINFRIDSLQMNLYNAIKNDKPTEDYNEEISELNRYRYELEKSIEKYENIVKKKREYRDLILTFKKNFTRHGERFVRIEKNNIRDLYETWKRKYFDTKLW